MLSQIWGDSFSLTPPKLQVHVSREQSVCGHRNLHNTRTFVIPVGIKDTQPHRAASAITLIKERSLLLMCARKLQRTRLLRQQNTAKGDGEGIEDAVGPGTPPKATESNFRPPP